ncbi:MAG: glutaredoxin family protein [Gemmataceae bacterium]|nr:glutaredoxin family protein [Gemmataceae bacterium]
MLTRWWRWWRERRPSSDAEVVLFTRAGCHLCEEAHEFLHAEQARLPFRLVVRDVDASPETRHEYGECVPVVLVDGRVRFRGRIDPVLWRRLMRHRSRGSAGS